MPTMECPGHRFEYEVAPDDSISQAPHPVLGAVDEWRFDSQQPRGRGSGPPSSSMPPPGGGGFPGVAVTHPLHLGQSSLGLASSYQQTGSSSRDSRASARHQLQRGILGPRGPRSTLSAVDAPAAEYDYAGTVGAGSAYPGDDGGSFLSVREASTTPRPASAVSSQHGVLVTRDKAAIKAGCGCAPGCGHVDEHDAGTLGRRAPPIGGTIVTAPLDWNERSPLEPIFQPGLVATRKREHGLGGFVAPNKNSINIVAAQHHGSQAPMLPRAPPRLPQNLRHATAETVVDSTFDSSSGSPSCRLLGHNLLASGLGEHEHEHEQQEHRHRHRLPRPTPPPSSPHAALLAPGAAAPKSQHLRPSGSNPTNASIPSPSSSSSLAAPRPLHLHLHSHSHLSRGQINVMENLRTLLLSATAEGKASIGVLGRGERAAPLREARARDALRLQNEVRDSIRRLEDEHGAERGSLGVEDMLAVTLGEFYTAPSSREEDIGRGGHS